jgi:hypothetical protein
MEAEFPILMGVTRMAKSHFCQPFHHKTAKLIQKSPKKIKNWGGGLGTLHRKSTLLLALNKTLF